MEWPIETLPLTHTASCEDLLFEDQDRSLEGRRADRIPLRWWVGRRFESFPAEVLDSNLDGTVVSIKVDPPEPAILWVGLCSEWIEAEAEGRRRPENRKQVMAFGLNCWRRAVVVGVEPVGLGEHRLRLLFEEAPESPVPQSDPFR
ncbi:hypothetical protein BH23PLA1_BH23PLA1_36580 [soil metagenome]